MRICEDCFTVNPSYESYCQKCSGVLTSGGSNSYPHIKIAKKKTQRRVPVQLMNLFAHSPSSVLRSNHHN